MPAALIFVEAGSGQVASPRTRFGSRLVVRVFDEMDNWMPNEMVRFALPPSLAEPSGRFVDGSFDYNTITNLEGRATSEFIDADDLPGTWVGTVVVVSNPLVRADFYLSNTPRYGAPATLLIIDNGTQMVAQYGAYLAVRVRLVDAGGVGIPTETIFMACPAGTGTFPGGGITTTAGTNDTGYATFPVFTASGVTGTFEPVISYVPLTPPHCSFTTYDPALPTSISTYAGNNQSVPTSTPFSSQLVARVANAINAPMAGVSVTFDAPNSGASLVWASPFTDPVVRTSDVSGYATSPSLSANATAGTYLVPATVSGIALPANFQLTNGGSPPISETSALLLCEV